MQIRAGRRVAQVSTEDGSPNSRVYWRKRIIADDKRGHIGDSRRCPRDVCAMMREVRVGNRTGDVSPTSDRCGRRPREYAVSRKSDDHQDPEIKPATSEEARRVTPSAKQFDVRQDVPVRLESLILAPNPGLGNIAQRTMSDLR